MATKKSTTSTAPASTVTTSEMAAAFSALADIPAPTATLATPTATQTKAIAVAIEGTTVIISPKGGQPLRANSTMLSPDIISRLITHGLKQKLIDAAAIGRDEKTGRSATIGEKMAAIDSVWKMLLDGEWSKKREAFDPLTLLREALISMGQTAVKVDAFLASKSETEKRTLCESKKVAAAIAALRKPASTELDDELDAFLNG